MSKHEKRTVNGLTRPYRLLNTEPSAGPVAMLNGMHRWCMTLAEAKEEAAFARAHGYRVEIVCAVEDQP